MIKSHPPIEIATEKLAWFFGETIHVVSQSRLPTPREDIFFYCPDSGNYKGVWTRDFCYIAENVPELLDPANSKRIFTRLWAGQRADGGVPCMLSMSNETPYLTVGNKAFTDTDNSMFLIKQVKAYVDVTGDLDAVAARWPSMVRAMDYVPRDRRGLVWIDPDMPYTGYGFTDCWHKRGAELFCTLLYWEASQILADFARALDRPDDEEEFRRRAGRIEKQIHTFWNESVGALAVTDRMLEFPDVWGNAYLLHIGFPAGELNDRIGDWLVKNYERCVSRGQVRHLPTPLYWPDTPYEVPKDEYQQGGYWGTASGWMFTALAQKDPALAARMATDMIDDFRQNGVYESINRHHTKVKNYVASVTNPAGALKRLLGIRDIRDAARSGH